MSENNDSGRSDRTRDSMNDATNPRSAADHTPPSPTESRRSGRKRGTSNEAFTRRDWENLDSNPDIRSDLGYELAPWETIDTATDSRQVIFMPQNEELLKDDAFIVADESALCDLGKQY